eukprot:871209-Pyramimonas_sp.AAC.1
MEVDAMLIHLSNHTYNRVPNPLIITSKARYADLLSCLLEVVNTLCKLSNLDSAVLISGFPDVGPWAYPSERRGGDVRRSGPGRGGREEDHSLFWLSSPPFRLRVLSFSSADRLFATA